jgi:hypothetical protein
MSESDLGECMRGGVAVIWYQFSSGSITTVVLALNVAGDTVEGVDLVQVDRSESLRKPEPQFEDSQPPSMTADVVLQIRKLDELQDTRVEKRSARGGKALRATGIRPGQVTLEPLVRLGKYSRGHNHRAYVK